MIGERSIGSTVNVQRSAGDCGTERQLLGGLLPSLAARGSDTALAGLIAAITVLGIATAQEPGARAPDVFAYALGTTASLALVARHRWPVVVVIATVVAQSFYHGRAYPGAGVVLALLTALYTAAAFGRRQRSLLVGLAILASLLMNRALVERTQVMSTTTMAYAGISAAVLLLGDAVRSRRALLVETRERVRRAELEREAEAGRRVAEERLHIARELHDVLSHTITAISVQAGVAEELIEKQPAQARAALQAIRASSRQARSELQALLGVLRETGPAELTPQPGLARLAELLEPLGAAGVRTKLSLSGNRRELPTAVDLIAYRIVQEALTNVLRHARARNVAVTLHFECDALTIAVADDGIGPLQQGNNDYTHGLQGMRERISAIGGRLEVGPAPGGGFQIHARLPAGTVRV